MKLTEFLLARIADDEAVARATTQGQPQGPWRETATDDGEPAISVFGYPADPIILRATEYADVEHIARHDPARVLAEVEAKRRFVCLAQNAPGDQRSFQSPLIDVLLAHVAVYADHPDYRPEWKP